MTTLFLIRHGQTDWNFEGRYQGQADIPLNGTGLFQARQLASRIKDQQLDAIFSSDLLRARQTAEALAAEMGIQVRLDSRLREIDQGEWEGQLMSDIIHRYHEQYHDRSREPERARAPGGESVLEVSRRVIEVVDEICQTYPDGKVVLVSHGLALATIIAKSKGLPLKEVYSLIPNNADLHVVEWQNNGKPHWSI